MPVISTADRSNIFKLVAGMFNAAPGAIHLKEFSDAFIALNSDYSVRAGDEHDCRGQAQLGRNPGQDLRL